MSKTIKIKVLDSVAGKDFAYGRGFIGEVPEGIAKDLIKGGLAVEAGTPKRETATAPQYETKAKK